MVDPANLTKRYYSIGDVASMFEVKESTLRYWENEFPQLNPGKNRRGDRRYTKDDILIIRKIYTLLKIRAFTLKGAKEELKNELKAQKQNDKIIAKLKKLKKSMEALRSNLKRFGQV